MLKLLTILTLAGGMLCLSVSAGEFAAVREIDLKGLKRGRPTGKIDQPTEIKSAAELAKSFPEEEWQEKLAKQVDLAKEKLIFFAWAGSGQDKITASIDKGDKQPTATFQIQRGLTRDLRSHFRLYVLPKDATWKVTAKNP